MKNWIFLDERSEHGITYMLGKKLPDGALFRWEPLATRVHGYDAAMFRQIAEKRSKIRLNGPEASGILILEKPLNHQGQLWIGWEARPGKCPFSSEYTQPELIKTIQNLYPLIMAYEQFHYRGLVVGRPDWRRIFWGDHHFFMVDPWCRPYLQSPDFPLPAGLSACRTPESFFGGEPAQSGDIFYLGLLIYYLISNKLPYSLEEGWPTKALLKGEIIPITHYRPDVSPALARLIIRMLAVKKHQRPSALQVQLFWKEMLSQENFIATPNEKVVHLQKYRQYTHQRTIKKYGLRLGLILAIVLFSGLTGRLLFKAASREIPISRRMVEQFYQSGTNMLNATAPADHKKDIFQDITDVRNLRLKLANELLERPVIEVNQIAVRSQTSRLAVIDVSLDWWQWSDGIWSKQTTHEQLHLEKKHHRWQVSQRFRKPM